MPSSAQINPYRDNHLQLYSVGGPMVARTSTSLAMTSSTRSTSTTTAMPSPISSTSSSSRPSDEPEYVPVQHRADHLAHSPSWNRRQFYQRSPGGEWEITRPRHQAGLPTLQHRPALHAQLRHAGAGCGAHPARWRSRCSPDSGAKGSTSTSARSSTSAISAVPEAPSDPLAGSLGVDATKAVNVHSIAIQVPITD